MSERSLVFIEGPTPLASKPLFAAYLFPILAKKGLQSFSRSMEVPEL